MVVKYKYSVAIQCMTYNHSKYITDALDGFVKQNTDFPFVILLVDDASTDGEEKVISDYIEENFNLGNKAITYEKETEYAKITYAQHKTNNNCFIVAMYLKYNHYLIGKKLDKLKYLEEWIDNSKYIALCEGDDYWIDCNKLQKQVDFLESKPDYSMCFHKAKIVNELNRDVPLKSHVIENRDYTANELFYNWIVPTASMLYRKEVMCFPYKKQERLLNGDINIVLTCAMLGKIYAFNDTMSVYRMQSTGVTYNKKLQKQRALKSPDHFLYIKDNFSNILSKRLINKSISQAYWGRIFAQETIINKIKDLLLSFCYHPIFTIKELLKFIKSFFNKEN